MKRGREGRRDRWVGRTPEDDGGDEDGKDDAHRSELVPVERDVTPDLYARAKRSVGHDQQVVAWLRTYDVLWVWGVDNFDAGRVLSSDD